MVLKSLPNPRKNNKRPSYYRIVGAVTELEDAVELMIEHLKQRDKENDERDKDNEVMWKAIDDLATICDDEDKRLLRIEKILKIKKKK